MARIHFKSLALERTPTDDAARSFLQERLAYLGRAYASIGLGFYVAGNLIAAGLAPSLSRRLSDPLTWIVPAACVVYLTQWLLSRHGALRQAVLRAIDGAATGLAAVFHSMMVFTAAPGEPPGLSYARAMLLISFGLLIRAIIVPSSALRTFLLGLLAVCASAVTAHFWYATLPATTLPPSLQVILTAMWSLGAVVISTLASHVIFGLRREVREARQLGQYKLIEKIGEGGMGAVYRASHAMLRRPTAIKLLPADKAGAERIQRFEREVQLTSQLTHPNTVSIFDYGRTPDGVFYYAMEYLDGVNLEELVRLDGAQLAGRVVHILRQVAGSLSEAHGVGLVHRDIKPGNVILVPERGGARDVAKVVDFGLVKELDEIVGLTGAGRLAGTPHYMSPEAISSPADIVVQSDLYSLGCVGYYLLTGQTVFEGRTVVEVSSHHLDSQPVPPGERLGRPVPETLSRILLACLEKTPAGRPASALALIHMLDACHDVEPWTSDMARVWWTLQGSGVRARSRRERAIAPVTEPVIATALASA